MQLIRRCNKNVRMCCKIIVLKLFEWRQKNVGTNTKSLHREMLARCTFQFLIDWRWSCAWESETMILSEKLNRNTKSRFHFGCRHIVRVNEIKNYRQNNGSSNSNIVQTSSIDECKIVFEAVWIRANRSPTKLILKQDNKITKWRRRKRWIAVWIPF